MVIFIRHGNDKNDGCKNEKYSHDPTISKHGKKEVSKITHKMVDKYGIPKVIYCSPFKRCRETVKIMLEHFHDCEKLPIIVVDNRLSKFYTEKQQKKPNMRPSTRKFDPPVYECDHDVMERSMDIHDELCRKSNRVWCVTHAIVVRYVSMRTDEEIPHVEFLQMVVI